MQVHLLAAAVLLSERVLPYATRSATPAATEAQLAQLAALVAAAGLPPGHRIELDTNLVCFLQLGDSVEVKLEAPAAAAAGAAAEGDGLLSAAAGSVVASLGPPPAHSCWPAALGPNAPPGSGSEVQVVIAG